MEHSAFEEQQILERVRTGDLMAFESLVLRYERRIFYHIVRVVHNHETAEDLTQETFIKVYRCRHTIDTAHNFRSWLYTIATNTVRDWLRHQRTHKELFVIDEGEETTETIVPATTYDTARAAFSTDITTALRRIKPIHKTVLLLFYIKDRGYREIADSLGIPINTVKTHLHRAKRALHRELGSTYLS